MKKRTVINFNNAIEKIAENAYQWRDYATAFQKWMPLAKRVGFQTGGMLKIKGGKTQTQGVRSVQKSFESAKCIIINVGKGIFPKSTIE